MLIKHMIIKLVRDCTFRGNLLSDNHLSNYMVWDIITESNKEMYSDDLMFSFIVWK